MTYPVTAFVAYYESSRARSLRDLRREDGRRCEETNVGETEECPRKCSPKAQLRFTVPSPPLHQERPGSSTW